MNRTRRIIVGLLAAGAITVSGGLAACGSSGPSYASYDCGYALPAPAAPAPDGGVQQAAADNVTFVDAGLEVTRKPTPNTRATTRGTTGGGAGSGATTGSRPSTSAAPRATGPGGSGSTPTARPTARPRPTVSLPPAPLMDTQQSPKNEAAYKPARGEFADNDPGLVTAKQDIQGVNATLPQGGSSDHLRLSRDPHQGYESPVTHHIYVFHDLSYYHGLHWHDPYNPYDDYNWVTHSHWYSPFDPVWHTTYVGYPASWTYQRVIVIADRC